MQRLKLELKGKNKFQYSFCINRPINHCGLCHSLLNICGMGTVSNIYKNGQAHFPNTSVSNIFVCECENSMAKSRYAVIFSPWNWNLPGKRFHNQSTIVWNLFWVLYFIWNRHDSSENGWKQRCACQSWHCPFKLAESGYLLLTNSMNFQGKCNWNGTI
jgi:hypothetical protein